MRFQDIVGVEPLLASRLYVWNILVKPEQLLACFTHCLNLPSENAASASASSASTALGSMYMSNIVPTKVLSVLVVLSFMKHEPIVSGLPVGWMLLKASSALTSPTS